MILSVTIPDTLERAAMATDIKHLLAHYDIPIKTYKPHNADMGLEAKKELSQKLLGRVIGLIQRRGYEVTIQDHGPTIRKQQ